MTEIESTISYIKEKKEFWVYCLEAAPDDKDAEKMIKLCDDFIKGATIGRKPKS